MELQERIEDALEVAFQWGQVDGDHHKAWVIDEMVRCLTGCASAKGLHETDEYKQWVAKYEQSDDEDDDCFYEWDTGIAP